MGTDMTQAVTLSRIADAPVSREVDTALIRELFATKQLVTPLLLLSRRGVRRNYDALKAALPRAEIHYAVKSNNHTAVLDEVCKAGGNFDVCSAREIDDLVHAGVDSSRIVHSHPVKSIHEFDAAVARGTRIFVVDNIDEIEKLRRYTDTKLKVLIRYRINTNTTAVVNLQY